MSFSTADLYDFCWGQGLPLAVCELRLVNFGGRRVFHGQIVTVRCEDDNPRVRKVLEGNGEGRILVVDGRASLNALGLFVCYEADTDEFWAARSCR